MQALLVDFISLRTANEASLFKMYVAKLQESSGLSRAPNSYKGSLRAPSALHKFCKGSRI